MMYDDIQKWLCNQAQERNIQAVFDLDRIEPHDGWVKLPARIEGDDLDYGDRADRMQELEDSWNDQKPRPSVLLILETVKK